MAGRRQAADGSADAPRGVVVTGMGLVSAIGNRVDEFRDRLFAGASGVREIDGFDTAGCRTQLGATVDGVDFLSHVSRKEMLLLDRTALLAIVAADQAIADAGLDLERDRSRLGVILGTGSGPSASIEDSVRRHNSGRKLRPTTVLKVMLSSPAAALCARYQCREVSHVHVTACAASAHAIAEAAGYIRRGELDLCLAGGCDAFPGVTLFAAWDALEVMSPDNGAPQTAMRPFAVDRNGFVIGEGAAMLILESEERARARGARIQGEVAGAGSCSYTPHLTRPSLDGMAVAMSRALRQAALPAAEVGYVNAHGTATELNDVLETEALQRVFGDHARRLQISSTKAAHGHAMGASGAIEAVATLLSLQQGIAPPTLNLVDPDPRCDLDYTPCRARELDTRAAVSNSFAFGGHYVSLVFRYDAADA